MDRRQRLLLRLYSSVAIFGILAGCTTLAVEQTSNFSESSESVTVEDTSEFPVPDDIVELIPDDPVPEASLSSASPRISPGQTDDLAGRDAITGEFHLSADTGWLVLPVPRISDDLPLQYPPSSPDAISGLLLIHPALPITSNDADPSPPPVAVTIPSADEDEVADETERGEAHPERSSAALVESGPLTGLGVALDVGSAGSAVPQVVMPRQADAGAAAAVPPETSWLQRSATADPGSDVVITLSGRGWLYVGREFGAGIADLITTRSVAGNEEFVFQFSESGDYGLWFQRQDPLSGLITNERLQVDASPGGSDQISVVSLVETTPVAAGMNDAVVPQVVEMPSAGPVGVTTEDPVDGPSQWRERAVAASLSGNMPVAVEYWQKIIAAGGADAHLARESLFALAVGAADGVTAAVLGAGVEALRLAGELDGERLLQAAEAADAAGLYTNAAAYYGELSELNPGVDGLDGIYFRLAQILEMPGPARDLRHARALYEAVIDRYPLSRYWDESAGRIEYLKRHYFEIR